MFMKHFNKFHEQISKDNSQKWLPSAATQVFKRCDKLSKFAAISSSWVISFQAFFSAFFKESTPSYLVEDTSSVRSTIQNNLFG